MNTLDKQYLEKIKKELNKDIQNLIDINQRPSGGHIETGFVKSFADGIGVITGLEKAKIGQKLKFEASTQRAEEEIFGQIIDIDEDTVSCVVFGEERFVKEGDDVTLDKTQDVLSVFASEAQLGHVVDPFGRPMDLPNGDEEKSKEKSNDLVRVWTKIQGKKKIEYRFVAVERDAPPLISRSPINTPLHTGIKAIDTMMPIGLGQRMLIIGDRGTGKTALGVATILHQAKLNEHRPPDKQIIFIYVAIGKKISEIVSIKRTLENCKFGKENEDSADKYAIIVATKANDPAALLYIAPFSGCSIGEYFRDRGKNAVVIYDDLTKHANAYRHISLLLKRAPGREAFPGDIFYLHSRLLERAASVFYEEGENPNELVYSMPMNETEKESGKKQEVGSLTAFPIIETKENDFSAYIPTNVISITDGQIYLDNALFNEEILPAVHTGLSVSRVGSKAQTGLMKQLSKNLKADLAVFKEKKKYQSFGFDLSAEDLIVVNHGDRAYKYLKQGLNHTDDERDQLRDLAKIEIQKLIEIENIKDKTSRTFFGKDINSSTAEILSAAFDAYAKNYKLLRSESEKEEKYIGKFRVSGFNDYNDFKDKVVKDNNLIIFLDKILTKNKEQNADNKTA